eukprot:CAMPEP_0178503584 /NCGR_PEP_ID=MMETSP0696-20121128/18122_1 /TAXON_ID=265572 /ORGANISM="Extubocellulus spinifer, Strain CCMP396" /LENGTH=209 /DNA_ID=CAMNT_0020132731 /DNA_START=136 /DNA_END=761 /DNA_ORIENTATION=+
MFSLGTKRKVATPHVAGVVLILWNNFPWCKNFEIREALLQSAQPLTDDQFPTSPNHGYGHGAVKYWAAHDYLMNNPCEQAPSASPSAAPSVDASSSPSVSPTLPPSPDPSSSPSAPPTDSSVCGNSFDNTCVELIEESCSAADFNCFSPYVTLKQASGDKAKVEVWQLVNEVEAGDCSGSDDEYQVLYSRIRNDNGELECRKKNSEECG